VDVRPPALEKVYTNEDGSTRFKHLIEPYLTYRLISGIGGEFNRIIRFDDSDAVANTNEFEYAIVNRFFTRQFASDLTRKRAKGRRLPTDMKPVQKDKVDSEKESPAATTNAKPEPSARTEPATTEATVGTKPEQTKTDASKPKLQTGKQEELKQKDRASQDQQTTERRTGEKKPNTVEEARRPSDAQQPGATQDAASTEARSSKAGGTSSIPSTRSLVLHSADARAVFLR
jgi:hypothetical protein